MNAGGSCIDQDAVVHQQRDIDAVLAHLQEDIDSQAKNKVDPLHDGKVLLWGEPFWGRKRDTNVNQLLILHRDHHAAIPSIIAYRSIHQLKKHINEQLPLLVHPASRRLKIGWAQTNEQQASRAVPRTSSNSYLPYKNMGSIYARA